MRLILPLFLCVIVWNKAASQCCTANPVAGNVNVGILNKKSFRAILYYRYNFSDAFYEGSKRSGFNAKSASYNYTGTILAYGLTNKITLEAELGYFINKSEVLNTIPAYTLKRWGFNNSVISAKHIFYKNGANEIEITGVVGAKIPFNTKPLEVDGVQLPQTIHPSTGAYGGVAQLFLYKGYVKQGFRLFLLHRFETNTANAIKYRYGNSYVTSLFFSKSINHYWTGILQVRNESRGKDVRENKTISASGGYTFFLSPQINYSIAQKWNISALTDFPIYRYYNGTQLSNKYAFSVNITRDF